ncbi:hypothetical protein GQ43DRAFT_410463 [Delitschia confertaspora ATCC 74209]|uniref:Uncharacterized protein n=1 Tax=Delitschia confertaspora ATCC 74209 TaxID=1513339 RepID=A0A9P4JVH0_9PLEO|nr:hypothetical protein GQ43DRAFT_410463 [Delitschia confertaspora ATCC 74209]
MYFISLSTRLGLLLLGATKTWATCYSYGMDFQHEGIYFQNSLSSDNFTHVTQFEGCNDDVAYNFLVDPYGEQYICSDTRLTPDDSDMLSTCPITKSQLFSGFWTVVVFSNNGNSDPIAYQRDFSLSVGPQSTTTFTPTITATITSTPVINQTVTSTDTSTTTLLPITVTNPSTTIKPTTTVTPPKVTMTSTRTAFTLSLTSYTLRIVPATRTKTATCKAPTKQAKHDPTATITPTMSALASVFPTEISISAGSAKFRMRGNPLSNKAAFLKARSARLESQLGKRAPDPQPLVVTDTVTSNWGTVTSTSTASAVYVTINVAVTTTSTLTPAPVTVVYGSTVAPVVTITAPTPTKTVTKNTIAKSTVTTKTINYTYTITKTTTPASVSTECKYHGGILN